MYSAERLNEKDRLTEYENKQLQIIQDVVGLTENYNRRNDVFSPFAILKDPFQ